MRNKNYTKNLDKIKLKGQKVDLAIVDDIRSLAKRQDSLKDAINKINKKINLKEGAVLGAFNKAQKAEADFNKSLASLQKLYDGYTEARAEARPLFQEGTSVFEALDRLIPQFALASKDLGIDPNSSSAYKSAKANHNELAGELDELETERNLANRIKPVVNSGLLNRNK